MDPIATPAIIAFAVAMGFMMLIAMAKAFLVIGRPNQLIVFSGRQRQLTDGSRVGYRELIGGGRSWAVPFLEKVDRMPLTVIPIDIRVTNAYSKGGIPLQVHAIANIKVTSNPKLIGNAIERFMGRDSREIQQVGKETLEGHLRGVLATMTPEEVNEDRLVFAQRLSSEADDDFDKLGLTIDILKIQNVSDTVNYLESISRTRVSEVIRDAQIAESNAHAEAVQQEAIAHKKAEVAEQKAQKAIVKAENNYRELKAKLDADIQSAEELAERTAAKAKADSDSELQQVRQELEQLRLIADVILPAEAKKKADEYRARGAAAFTEEKGLAMAEVLMMITEAWKKAGDDAKDIFLIQQLEEIMQTVIERVNNLDIDEVVLLDGGDGEALPKHVASYPGMVRKVLDELKSSTGVDVLGILSNKGEE